MAYGCHAVASRMTEEPDMTFPQHGQVITFTKTPPTSYCTAGVAYRVDRPGNKGDFRFENVARGSATYDRPWAVKMSEWFIHE
jgi:hypothetical protein